jgi:two-component system, OmpR family, sensor histidine kinase MtrB
MSVPSQPRVDRSALPVPPRMAAPPPTGAAVDPTALPGSGARVVARPAGERSADHDGDDPLRTAQEREDTTRGR